MGNDICGAKFQVRDPDLNRPDNPGLSVPPDDVKVTAHLEPVYADLEHRHGINSR
jgi:hypothetical protein